MPHAENELVKMALQESKDFSKSIRQYLYNMSKERQLTDTEKELYELTHEIHVRTNDALLILNEQVIETETLHHEQIVRDNYDILHNPEVKKKYPKLYTEVLEHDKISTSSWYDLTEKAYVEFQAYIQDKSIGYVQ